MGPDRSPSAPQADDRAVCERSETKRAPTRRPQPRPKHRVPSGPGEVCRPVRRPHRAAAFGRRGGREVRITRVAAHHADRAWTATAALHVGRRGVVVLAEEATGRDVVDQLQDRPRRQIDKAARAGRNDPPDGGPAVARRPWNRSPRLPREAARRRTLTRRESAVGTGPVGDGPPIRRRSWRAVQPIRLTNGPLTALTVTGNAVRCGSRSTGQNEELCAGEGVPGGQRCRGARRDTAATF